MLRAERTSVVIDHEAMLVNPAGLKGMVIMDQ